MKLFKYLFFISVLAGVLQSCFKDTSTLDINEITGVEIDTTGMSSLSVYQFDTLNVEPNLNIGNLSESDLLYEWKINLRPNDTVYEVISEEKNLEYEINFRPNTSGQTHQLYYTITDLTTGLDYIMTWPVTVRNNIGEGLVIAETPDGVNTDISHIMAPQVTPDYDKVSVKHNIYSILNGSTLPGLVKQMRFAKIYGVDAIMAITDEDFYRINTLDYSFGGMNDDLFFGSKPEYNPQALGAVSQSDIYIGNNQLTATYLGASRKFALPFDTSYQVPDHVAFNPFTYYPLPVRISFYDESNDHFVYLPSLSAWGDNNMYVTPNSEEGVFNPSNLPNKVNLAASVSTDGDFRHILKDQETGEIALYVLDGGQDGFPTVGPPAPKNLFSLANAPGIEEADNFTFLDNQKVLYYTSGNVLYAMLYSGNEPVFEERYKFSDAEEITTVQVYRQADYPFRSEGFDPPYINTNNKQLIVSTYGSEGKVYLLPFVNAGVGNIDDSNIQVFGGFDRITAITTQL
ncbi:PKD-like family lipoprotein [Salegentibacter mishustinae]|uniref:PKD-like family protein n=1 Tax=Salegentibacter mishustinae TaxID=270918 RepID=A0A0Q9ZPQ6_9FLAO|nr:PKD-like family lipoprotein [Salegentibacter mishustinae]KRG30536.1 hypothetical protein APR42_01325 [Salegentibacter mishustinae]PNW23427.1 hypothetical protein APB85_01320 [Salegentibacter mishustinae]PZX66494.1 PKD family protein [Salegentibacter mishustinae]GGW82861.1 hypothetical protein GCM10008086_08560 [Salegentibacter mishustinae]